MSAGRMIRMVLRMADSGGSREPAHHHNDKQQSPNYGGSSCVHRHAVWLVQRGRLHRFRFLNPCHRVENHLLCQKAALDVFLDDALFVNKHADR